MNWKQSSLVLAEPIVKRSALRPVTVHFCGALLAWQAAAIGWCCEFAFRHHFIDRDLPGASYGQTCLVDVDKDGDLDASSEGDVEMIGFNQNPLD